MHHGPPNDLISNSPSSPSEDISGRSLSKQNEFFVDALGLKEIRRIPVEEGRFTLFFLAAEGDEDSQIELTYNLDGDDSHLP